MIIDTIEEAEIEEAEIEKEMESSAELDLIIDDTVKVRNQSVRNLTIQNAT